MKDKPTLIDGHLIYISTHENPKFLRTSWTVVYSTELSIGLTHRLTPSKIADFSPVVLPSGKWTAVASYGERGWAGEVAELRVAMPDEELVDLKFMLLMDPIWLKIAKEDVHIVIARPGRSGLNDSLLQNSIDYACGNGADCSAILQNGRCYQPNTVKSHCESVTMQLTVATLVKSVQSLARPPISDPHMWETSKRLPFCRQFKVGRAKDWADLTRVGRSWRTEVKLGLRIVVWLTVATLVKFVQSLARPPISDPHMWETSKRLPFCRQFKVGRAKDWADLTRVGRSWRTEVKLGLRIVVWLTVATLVKFVQSLARPPISDPHMWETSKRLPFCRQFKVGRAKDWADLTRVGRSWRTEVKLGLRIVVWVCCVLL
ncbi:hypothetical protein ACFE04_005227 [Oxalis oulophora]